MESIHTAPDLCLAPDDGYDNQHTRVPMGVLEAAGYVQDPRGNVPNKLHVRGACNFAEEEDRVIGAIDEANESPKADDARARLQKWRRFREIAAISRKLAGEASPVVRRHYGTQLKACLAHYSPHDRKVAREYAASACGNSAKSIERLTQGHIEGSLATAAKDTSLDTHQNADRWSTLPTETQLRFARVIAAKREKLLHEREIEEQRKSRLKGLSYGTLARLEAIGLNNDAVRRDLGKLSTTARVKAVDRLEREHAARQTRGATVARIKADALAVIHTPAGSALAAAWAAATEADRAAFMESHALKRADRIPGESMAIYFEAVEGEG